MTKQVKLNSERLDELLKSSSMVKKNTTQGTYDHPMTKPKLKKVWIKDDPLCFVAHTTLTVVNALPLVPWQWLALDTSGDKSTYKQIDECKGGNVTFGDGSQSQVKDKGTVEIPGLPLPQNVLYDESLKVNLVSIVKYVMMISWSNSPRSNVMTSTTMENGSWED